jgi:hypothetical protein
MPGKNVLERRSGLRHSEKELRERRPGAFRHNNPPGVDVISRDNQYMNNSGFFTIPVSIHGPETSFPHEKLVSSTEMEHVWLQA